jgi:hypothetical protein
MNVMKTGIILAACVPCMAMAAPSAKFAATYTNEPMLSVSAVVTCDLPDVDSDIGNCQASANDNGHTLATIKVPQDKELLVGVSAEIGLTTFGAVKGKNGGSATAIADAEAAVSIHACPVGGGDCITAEPGGVKLSKRIQELSAKLGGVIKECDIAVDTTTGEGTFDVSDDCIVNDEEIALLLSTTASHHFNFVLPNMDQGEYDIKAMFTTAASAEVVLCDYENSKGYTTEDCDADGTVAATAEAASVINKTMLTVQTVRAAKGGIIDADIVD